MKTFILLLALITSNVYAEGLFQNRQDCQLVADRLALAISYRAGGISLSTALNSSIERYAGKGREWLDQNVKEVLFNEYAIQKIYGLDLLDVDGYDRTFMRKCLAKLGERAR